MNTTIIGIAMIFIVVAIMVVLTLPSYFTSTHKLILSFIILMGAGVMIAMGLNK